LKIINAFVEVGFPSWHHRKHAGAARTSKETHVRLGVINLTHSSRAAVRVAQATEAAGFWGLGMGDTVPKLYQDTYVTTAECFAATENLRIGPTVTNTVTRHWSVLGATARTFGELYPGRFFAGVATGDGACHSVGLQPASWAKVEQDVANAASWAPEGMEIHIAASGPRGCEAAGRVATDLILGTGLDVTALRTLSARARAARTAAGITAPLRVWAFVSTYVAPDRAAADEAWVTQRGRSVGTTRFSLASTFEDKNVPEAWQPILRERLARYDFTNHGVGAGNTNGHLFDDHPDIQEYLTHRFQLLGTADEVAARLRQVADDAGLDGCWCALPAMTPDEDMYGRVRTTGEALKSLADPPA
jgi:alkanesulfonate monooxygenase SsuD/methylene tetrahydromethanopterin reductase-like flavin-dependent oxidoreductase (luciferase family)